MKLCMGLWLLSSSQMTPRNFGFSKTDGRKSGPRRARGSKGVESR